MKVSVIPFSPKLCVNDLPNGAIFTTHGFNGGTHGPFIKINKVEVEKRETV